MFKKNEQRVRALIFEGRYKNEGFVRKELFGEDVTSSQIWLRTKIHSDPTCSFTYSLDGKNYPNSPMKLKTKPVAGLERW